jgi:hypothetical protein
MAVRKINKYREDNYIFKKNLNVIIDGIAGFKTPVQVESSICFANYLNYVGINSRNYHLFLKLIETNNKWIIDALIGKRKPRLLFSTIRPTRYLLKKAFKLLTFWHPREIYSKVLLACLGIIESAYYSPDDGYKIYPLKIADIDNLGKYLIQTKDQSFYTNRVILDVLDKISHLGEHNWTLLKSQLSKHAFRIRFGYFDNTKRLVDIIPQVLLIQLKREESEVKPSKEFIKFLESKKD